MSAARPLVASSVGWRTQGILTEGAVKPVRGQSGGDDEHYSPEGQPSPAPYGSGAAAPERNHDERDHDDICV